jgi:hypothetical protein
MFKKLCSYAVVGTAWLFLTVASSSVFWVTTKDPAALWGDNSLMDPTAGARSWGIGVAGAGTGQGEGFLDVVRNAINWVLGILALIALILLLWGGFQMVTSAGDETKYEAWFKILKNAAFGLIMIWVAWFVISLIFFVINLITV